MNDKVEKLRRNDPTVQCVFLRNRDRPDLYGDALRGNTVVNRLTVWLTHSFPAYYYDSLLNWIQVSPSLRTITIRTFFTNNIRLGFGFLQTIANNPGIQQVELERFSLQVELFASLLRSLRPSLKLTLRGIRFHTTNGVNAEAAVFRVVQDALRGNNSLQSLVADNVAPEFYSTVLPILSTRPTITELELSPACVDKIRSIQAIAEFLLSPPTTLEHLMLCFFENTDQGFELVLQRLMMMPSNNIVTKVTLDGCSFSEVATNRFKNLFSANPKIQTLALKGSFSFHGGADGTEAVLRDFVRGNTTLTELDIVGLSEPDQFSRILRALEDNSSIERLKCGAMEDEFFTALATGLSKITGVKELWFRLDGTYSFDKEDIMLAFKRNSSLTKVVIEQAPGTNYFTAADLRKIAFYTQRNKHAPEMLAAPLGEVPLSLRPKLYVAVRDSTAGPTQILRDLKRLGDKVGNKTSSSSSKRKRSGS